MTLANDASPAPLAVGERCKGVRGRRGLDAGGGWQETGRGQVSEGNVELSFWRRNAPATPSPVLVHSHGPPAFLSWLCRPQLPGAALSSVYLESEWLTSDLGLHLGSVVTWRCSGAGVGGGRVASQM